MRTLIEFAIPLVAPAERLVRFGPAHRATLLAIAALAVLAVVHARCSQPPAVRRLRQVLAFCMLSGAALEILVAAWQGWATWQDVAPLQLCDLNLALAAVGLLTLDRRLVEPLYFFALAGTLPALLTPELGADVLSFRFFAYFGLHGLTVIATLLLTLGLQVLPRPSAWWRSVLWLNAYAALIALVNLALGTNFMYLRAKPVDPTPFDWLGPWPWYLVSLEAVCLALFFLLEQPLRWLRAPECNKTSPVEPAPAALRYSRL